MIRVLLDGSPLARGHSGTTSYLEGLIEAMRASGEVDVTVASAPARARGRANGRRGVLGTVRSAGNVAARRRWLARELPRQAADAGADVLHHPLPAIVPRSNAAQVVTVHDLAFERLPWAFDPLWRLPARMGHRRAARSAQAVVCVSESTARDARALWGISPERIVTAHHGVQARAPGRLPEHLAGAEFALYVGDDEPRKNLGMLLDAWLGMAEERTLVIAGAAAHSPRLAAARGKIARVPDPDPGELAALYKGASLLIHPSLHEGFGLTPLEAMAHGTPVLCARSPALVEVCGDAASYFDPRDPGELARELSRLWSDPPERERLGKAGVEQAGRFTWTRSAERHVEAYEMAIRAKEAAGR